MLARFAVWAARPWDITRIADIGADDRRLLHRLLHCAVVHAGGRSDLAAAQPDLSSLARLKLQIARHTSRTIQVDMAGHLEAKDYASLVFASQDLLGHAVDALAAGYLLTNPTAKWRSRLLASLPAEWETALGIRPSGWSAAELFWRLHRAPERPDRLEAGRHALKIATFARAAFAWAEQRLLGAPCDGRRPIRWPRVDRVSEDAALPYLAIDVDFSAHGDGVMIGRLNAFGTPLGLSRREFEMALLFDGSTTPREAEIAICGSYAVDASKRLVDHMISRVAEAGFSVTSGRN